MVWTRYRLSLVFRLSLGCSKFTFSAGIQLFGLKTTLHGKSDLKNSFLRSDLPCEVVFRPKSWIPMENMNLNLLQSGLRLKTRLSLYLTLTLTQKKFQLFLKKIISASMSVHHVKGKPAASTYVQEKGCFQKYSNRDTPCRTRPFSGRADSSMRKSKRGRRCCAGKRRDPREAAEARKAERKEGSRAAAKTKNWLNSCRRDPRKNARPQINMIFFLHFKFEEVLESKVSSNLPIIFQSPGRISGFFRPYIFVRTKALFVRVLSPRKGQGRQPEAFPRVKRVLKGFVRRKI